MRGGKGVRKEGQIIYHGGYTAEQKKTVLQRIAELFQRIVERIKALISDGNLSDIAADFAEAQADEAARLRQMFLEVLDGMEVAEGATEEQREAKHAIKHPSFTEQQMEENKKELANMKSVYHVPAEKLNKSGKKPSTIFSEAFAQWGNNIYSKQFGDIAVSKQSVRSEIRHGITSEKLASIEAIPSVIENGKVIFYGTKENNVSERIVVAAPISIEEDNYYMGVMLHRDYQSQRLYLHNVVIEKETSNESKAHLLTTGSLETNERFFITTILQDAINVKRKLNEADSGEKFSLPTGGDYTVNEDGLVEIGRIFTFGTQNNMDIVRRLVGTSPFFKGMTIADAAKQYRYAEQNGLVKRGDGYLVVYHDANIEGVEGEHQTRAEQMDKLRLSLGLEAQNRSLQVQI